MKTMYVLACACLFLLSCSDDSNPTDTPEAIVASDYYPIESGATRTTVRIEGEERDTSTVVVSGPVAQLIGAKSEQVYTLTESSGNSGGYYFSENGLYQVMLPYSEDFLVFPNGIEIGDTWTNELEGEADYELTCVSISQNRTIVASDGTASTFESIVEVSFQKSDFGTATAYYAKGIGPVLTTFTQGTNTTVIKTIAHNGQEIVWE